MTTLPPEIWTKILGYLSLRDIEEGAIVYRSWKKSIKGYQSISISIEEHQFQHLLNDIDHHWIFVARVRQLEIPFISSRYTLKLLQSIINKLPNLLTLTIGGCQTIEPLKMLTLKDTTLPSIEKIDIGLMGQGSPSLCKLYFDISHKFRNTINSLDVHHISTR